MNDNQKFLQKNVYDAFNNREFETIISLMSPDVKWANGLEGGFIYGQSAVREYWIRQFKDIEVKLEPLSFETDERRRSVVTVHQIVRDLQGNLLADATIHQIFTIENGTILLYEIEETETIQERVQNTKTTNETQIRELLNDWAKATREGNNDAVLSNHASDVLIFDVLAPLQYEGAEAYRESWGEWHPESGGESLFEMHDLNITTGDTVAFGHCLIECGSKPNADWVRATFCLHKTNGKWEITHQHISMPMSRTGA